jgi:hypothetical protein
MTSARAPVAVIYVCLLTTVALVLALMIYLGVFDGFWDACIEIVKALAKFFSQ